MPFTFTSSEILALEIRVRELKCLHSAFAAFSSPIKALNTSRSEIPLAPLVSILYCAVFAHFPIRLFYKIHKNDCKWMERKADTDI